MPNYLGIDVGTSAVKAILIDDRQTPLAEAEVPLSISRPHDLWSEQDPESWWRAVGRAREHLHAEVPAAMAEVRGIGLSGQMHGAVLLNEQGKPLRPAILWNDGRSMREAEDLGKGYPELSESAGVIQEREDFIAGIRDVRNVYDDSQLRRLAMAALARKEQVEQFNVQADLRNRRIVAVLARCVRIDPGGPFADLTRGGDISDA